MLHVRALLNNRKFVKIIISCILVLALLCSAILLGIRYIPRRPFEDIKLVYAECYMEKPITVPVTQEGKSEVAYRETNMLYTFTPEELLYVEALVRKIEFYGLQTNFGGKDIVYAATLHIVDENGQEWFLRDAAYGNEMEGVDYKPCMQLGVGGKHVRSNEQPMESIQNLYESKRWAANGLQEPTYQGGEIVPSA